MDIKYFKDKRRTIKIEVTTKGDVRVFYPFNCSFDAVENFVLKKQKWIENKVRQTKGNFLDNREIFELKNILLLGNRIKIDFCDVKKAFLTENILFLPLKTQNNHDELKKVIKQFITKFAKELLPQAVAVFAERIGKCPTKIAISHPKSIWGSCNEKKEIRLNAKIVMLPKDLMEYVIVHELCHMTEMNHSEKFWNKVGNFFDVKYCRNALKEYNFLINLF
ncbi:MAG: M48 family metallopeptidase [Clostridiales bacterium]|nr:M48 family metallopeptidase [Clostridiales bacterium]